MKIESLSGTFASTVSGDVDITISGFGTPVAFVIYMESGEGGAQGNSISFTDGTTSWSSGYSCRPANYSRVATVSSINYCGSFVDSLTLSFSSWITDGVRLTVTSNRVTNDIRYYAVLIGGTGVTAKVGSLNPDTTAGNVVTVTTSQVNDLILLSSANGYSGYATFSLGCAASDSTQACVGRSVQHSSPYDVVQTFSDEDSLHITDLSGITSKFRVGNLTSTSFDLETTTGSPAGTEDIAYLSIDTGGKSATVAKYLTPTSTGTSTISTSFTPAGGFGALTYLADATSPISEDSTTTANTLSLTCFGNDLNIGTIRHYQIPGTTTDGGWRFTSLRLSDTATIVQGDTVSLSSSGATFDYSVVDSTSRVGFFGMVGEALSSGASIGLVNSGRVGSPLINGGLVS